jgi:hypothetical protein
MSLLDEVASSGSNFHDISYATSFPITRSGSWCSSAPYYEFFRRLVKTLTCLYFLFSPTLSQSGVVRLYEHNCIKNTIKVFLAPKVAVSDSSSFLLKFLRTSLHLPSTTSSHSSHGSSNIVSNLYEYFNLMRPSSFFEGSLSLSSDMDQSALNDQVLKAKCS